MNTRKYFVQFLRRLEHFPAWKLTAVTAATSERAWPNYVLFSELTAFGDVEEVRHCLNMLWDYVAGHQSAKNFERLLEKLEPNIPQLNQFDMLGTEPAHDAIITVVCGINGALESDAAEAASALTLSLNTVGKFIKQTEATELKGTELQQYIEQHDLYLQQMDFIDTIFETLSGARRTPTLMKQLRLLAANEGVSNIGISLE